jgi:hypothetical protein
MMDKIKAGLKPDPNAHARAGWDIRMMRLFITGALILAAIMTLRHLLTVELFEKNKLEVGLLLGWLIAKSGTVIDWLFGGSESGTRRADQIATQAASTPAGTPGDPLAVSGAAPDKPPVATTTEPPLPWPPERIE